MKASIPTVFYHAGGKWFGGEVAGAGWYCSDGDSTFPVIVAFPIAPKNPLRKLIDVGSLAMAHHRAMSSANSAKLAYHAAIKEYEGPWCDPEERIRPGGPNWDELASVTASEFAAYQKAKRIAYNIKRRLENACRKAAQP